MTAFSLTIKQWLETKYAWINLSVSYKLLYYDNDFYSIEEVEDYLKQFINKSDLN